MPQSIFRRGVRDKMANSDMSSSVVDMILPRTNSLGLMFLLLGTNVSRIVWIEIAWSRVILVKLIVRRDSGRSASLH